MKPRQVLCIVVAIFVTVAFAAGADTRPATATARAAKTETEYFAVFIGGKKAGHAKNTRTVGGGKVTTSEYMEVTIGRMGEPMTVKVANTCIETTDGRPLGFQVVQHAGAGAVKIKGVVGDRGKTTLIMTVGSNPTTTTFDWPKGALLSEGTRLASLKKGLKKGTTYTFSKFEPGLQRALKVDVQVGDKKKVDLLGRVVELTQVTRTMTGPTGQLVTTAYVDDELHDRKFIMPMFGQQLEIVLCSRLFARSKNDVIDFFDQLLLTSPVSLKDVAKTKTLTYRLRATKGQKLNIPTTDAQTVRKMDDGAIVVTVRPVAAPKGASFPYKGDNKTALAAMRPAQYLQSDDKKIVALARKAVGDTRDAAEAVARIEAFVHDYITAKNLSVGYASAAEVAASPQGDCTEHAVLAAAMCRAVGIPAQVAEGLTYVPKIGNRTDVFGPHAWFRAHIGGKWVPFDAIMRGSDTRRITLGTGDGGADGFFGIITTLGYFKITKVAVSD